MQGPSQVYMFVFDVDEVQFIGYNTARGRRSLPSYYATSLPSPAGAWRFQEARMSETFLLQVSKRTVTGKQVKRLRAQGLAPAVLYGPGIEAVPLQIDARALADTLAAAGGVNLITLDIEGEKQLSLVRDVQRDAITGALLHADFYAVTAGHTITAEIPLVHTGASPIVASGDGLMLTNITQVEIECLPKDLPTELSIDLSQLTKVGSSITVKDLTLPPGVTALSDPNEWIVRVAASFEQEEEEEAVEEEETLFEVEPAADQVEVIGKGKREEEIND